MSEPTTDVLTLTPDTLICDDHSWWHPADGAGPGGYSRLRVHTTEQGPLLAVASECGLGTTLTNSPLSILQVLHERYVPLEVVVIEHWPAEQRHGQETLDQVVLGARGRPQWRRIDPLEPSNLPHSAWMRRHGRRLLAAGGPWALPADLAQTLRARMHGNAEDAIEQLQQLADGPD